FRHMNPTRQGRLESSRLSPFKTLRQQIAFTPMKEKFDHVQINDTYFRGLNLLRLPESSHMGHLQRFLNGLWPDCDFVLTVRTLDTEKALSSLKLKNNITRTLAFSGWTKNYEAEQKHLELDELITEIRASAQRLFRFSLSVLVSGRNLEELRDKTNPVLNAFRDFASAEAASDDMNHGRLFLQSIPGHAELNDRQFYAQTDALAGFLPLSGTWRGSASKKALLETPMGELVGLDPFDPELPAKHGLVLGATGSGKSFTVNYLLNNFMIASQDNHVVIIDVGGSYRKTARTFDGEYLEVALEERFGFNPFPPKSKIAPNAVFDDDAVAYLSLLISRMCASAARTSDAYEKGFLERAIKAAYAGKEEVLLSDVREELYRLSAERPEAKGYADSLELWTQGMYGRLFNRKGCLKAEKRLVVFDLQNLENHPDLQSVYFFVIRSILWGKLVDRRLRKMIVIDEGWKFFNDETGSELIQGLYRTARKFNGAVLSVSQSPKDFLDTKAAAAIVANSYVKYVLKLAKGHELLSRFDLNENEIDAVKSLQSRPGEFSDIFVKFGPHSLIARIEPGPLDYWLCTTDARDYVKESSLREAHPGISEPELLLKLSEERCKSSR
ncbi:MAG: ATP-binding protein, partial [Elusimicrobia bacterium]|nr:ATP-binding protein [Elusimicrobiota bacterium]